VLFYSTFWNFTCSNRDTITQFRPADAAPRHAATSPAASAPAPARAFPRSSRAPRRLGVHPPSCHAPGRAPRRTGQSECRAGPSVRRLPFRTCRPEAPNHGTVHRLAPNHEVARLFKAATLLPARAHHTLRLARPPAHQGRCCETCSGDLPQSLPTTSVPCLGHLTRLARVQFRPHRPRRWPPYPQNSAQTKPR
jgi:hypothetical protein